MSRPKEQFKTRFTKTKKHRIKRISGIAKSLEPLRDFFLVMFFFSVGAMYDFSLVAELWSAIVFLTIIVLFFKPYAFRIFLVQVGEPIDTGWEMGSRLGQGSEFSLLLVKVALASGIISMHAASVIQGVTVLTFVLSSYWVVRQYQTPISAMGELEAH